MKKALLGLLLSFSGLSAVAQHISGRLVDSLTKEPIPFANVALTDGYKNLVGALTNDNGLWTLKTPGKGNYTINITLLGYSPVILKTSVDTKNVDMGDVSMVEGVQTEVATVTAKLITSDIDKTTYNTEADPEVQALNALEMMRKVPMLTVDGDDNIRLKGQTNFKILVNGKNSTMMSVNYKDVLKSMPASSIKNIEVITNPPAKYDAQGIGGIINIITERKTNNGYNGSLWLAGDSFGGFNGGGYIAAALGKFNLSANYYVGKYRSGERYSSSERENFFVDDAHYIRENSSFNYMGFYQGVNLEGSYEIDTLNLITLALSGNWGDNNSDNNNITNYFDKNNVLNKAFSNNSASYSHNFYIDGSLDYQKTFKKPDQTFTASYKFEYSPDNSRFENKIENILNYDDPYSKRSQNKAWGAEHSFQLDYFDPIDKHHQVEVGLKFVLRPNLSDSHNERLAGDQWLEDNALRNDLDYLQYIGSAYAAYQYKINKFSAKVGLRAEFTINEGTFKLMQDVSLFNRYFNVVPYVTFGFKPSDEQNLRLGYTQRLSRPGIWYLNPYINDEDPINISTGNPNLSSEISHSFDFSYGIYKSVFDINASLGASITGNSIEHITVMNPITGALWTAPENIGKRQNYTMNLSGSVRMFKEIVRLNLNASGAYVMVDANNGTGLKNQGWEYSVYAQLQSKVWKNGRVMLSGGLFGPNISLQGSGQLYYFSSIGVTQTFLDKKLRLSLSVNDPWTAKKISTNHLQSLAFSQYSRSERNVQSIRVNLSWRFGKLQTQVKKASRSISNDDVKAGGSNNAGE